MTKLYVVFLWHMHQPYYRDMVSGRRLMPWVRLHSCMGYLDMTAAVEESPGAKVTINLTPSLLEQLKEYIEGEAEDDFMILSEKPAAELTVEERAFVLRYFFMANWETMVRPYGEYLRLLGKRGTSSLQDFEKVQKKFTVAELRDLATWFNLTWFGWAALKMFPELVELKKKGRDFTEDDKQFVLTCQRRVMRALLPAHRRLWDQGAIEISASPMYHPILPLLHDTVLADRARPGVWLPPRFRHPEDAVAQVRLGLDYSERLFGRRPVGMWPSEGSVAEELAPAFLDAGVKWIATDEELLYKRVRVVRRGEALYHPWKVVDQGRELAVFFRDHALSDLIGFSYSKRLADHAADDFVARLREIKSSIARLGQDHAMVAVILDGENPWEAFPDRGRGFLLKTYQRIQETEGLELITASEYLERHPPGRALDRLPTGSWINKNFDIWIGGPEENKAWSYLGQVRDEAPRLLEGASPEARERALRSLYAAEGSDWFWWYGDQFHSDMDHEFDYLFRTHLKNFYLLLDRVPPLYLSEPVIHDHAVKVAEEPMSLLDPVIDGKVSDYYEWRCAGHVDLKLAQGAMYQSDRRLLHIYYGFNLTQFHLRLDPAAEVEDADRLEVRLHFLAPRRTFVRFRFKGMEAAQIFKESPEGAAIPADEVHSIAGGKIIELSVPFAALGLKAGDEAQFVVEIRERDVELERHPRDGFISFTVPDESFEAKHWSA